MMHPPKKNLENPASSSSAFSTLESPTSSTTSTWQAGISGNAELKRRTRLGAALAALFFSCLFSEVKKQKRKSQNIKDATPSMPNNHRTKL